MGTPSPQEKQHYGGMRNRTIPYQSTHNRRGYSNQNSKPTAPNQTHGCYRSTGVSRWFKENQAPYKSK
jgi:hypothetical protein